MPLSSVPDSSIVISPLVTTETDPTHSTLTITTSQEHLNETTGTRGEDEGIDDWDDCGLEEMLQNEEASKLFDSICLEQETHPNSSSSTVTDSQWIEEETESMIMEGMDNEGRVSAGGDIDSVLLTDDQYTGK